MNANQGFKIFYISDSMPLWQKACATARNICTSVGGVTIGCEHMNELNGRIAWTKHCAFFHFVPQNGEK